MAFSWLSFVSILSLILNCYGISRWDVFSTKTKYEWAHSTTANIDEYFTFTDGSKMCKAVHVNMVTRHGARWPSEDDMEDIKEIHERIIESKQSNVYPALDSWIPRYEESNEKQLTVEGQKEQQELGARLGLRLKTLFENNGQYIKYVSSSKSRTKNSNDVFHRGLLTNIPTLAEYSSEVNDALMRSFDECDNYEESMESDDNIEELIEFSKSLIFANITASLKEKLGISFNPSEDEIILINELCAHEKAIFNEESVWCELLTDNERTILEFRSDIKKYFESSYGNRISSKISCPLLGDMFHTMDKAINQEWDYNNMRDVSSNGYLAGKFYNGHSDTLIPLMTSLELFKDDVDLLLSNMEALVNRKFQTSKICPYSANLAFVLYVCDDSNSTNPNSTITTDRSFMLKMFVNEQPISIPACNADTCLYDTVRQYYSDLIDKCDIKAFCDDDDDCDDGTCGASSLGVSLIFVHLMALILRLL